MGEDSGRGCQRSHEGPLTRAEVDAKLGRGRWRPIERFRDGKWRTLDNGKSGSQNSATSATERIHTCGSTASVPVARRFRELLGVLLKDLGLVASTDDMQGAIRQIPVAPSSLCCTIIAAWNPEIHAMSFFQLYGMPFGLKGAVLDFSRISAALLAICRRWLALPALAFYDDFRGAELVGSCPSGSDSLNELFEWLGFRLDPTKHQKPSSSIVFLGTLETATCDGDPEFFGLLTKPGRVKNILKY